MGKYLNRVLNNIGKKTCKLITDDIEKQHLIKTGALRDSISFKVKNDTIEFDMIYYGHYLDKGTKYISPKRFFEKWITFQFEYYKTDILKAITDDLFENF